MTSSTSPDISATVPRKKRGATGARLVEIAKIAGAKSVEVRQAKARKRKLSETKVMNMVKQMIFARAQDLVRAAFVPAMGSTFVYEKIIERDEKNRITSTKHEQMTDPARIGYALDCLANNGGVDEEDSDRFYYIVAKDPDFRAIEMLMNRSMGKAVESVKIDATLKTFSLVALARERRSLPGVDLGTIAGHERGTLPGA